MVVLSQNCATYMNYNHPNMELCGWQFLAARYRGQPMQTFLWHPQWNEYLRTHYND